MEQLVDFLNLYSQYITLAVFGFFLLAFLTFIIVLNRLNQTKKKYRFLLRGMSNKNLEDIILENAEKISALEEDIQENSKRIDLLSESLNKFIKNIAVKRYNAFDGVGGEQSFSIALLDDEGNGVVLTSIHGRDAARTYAKPVIEGRSKYNLSEEEKIVLSSALYKKINN